MCQCLVSISTESSLWFWYLFFQVYTYCPPFRDNLPYHLFYIGHPMRGSVYESTLPRDSPWLCGTCSSESSIFSEPNSVLPLTRVVERFWKYSFHSYSGIPSCSGDNSHEPDTSMRRQGFATETASLVSPVLTPDDHASSKFHTKAIHTFNCVMVAFLWCCFWTRTRQALHVRAHHFSYADSLCFLVFGLPGILMIYLSK